MYNFALAFVICGVVYFIGEAVSNLTKAWIPSVFVTAAVLLVGFWTVIPTTVVSDSMLIPFGSTIGIYLLITHMGTVIHQAAGIPVEDHRCVPGWPCRYVRAVPGHSARRDRP